jgi:hemoglobin-like flavoprotein
MIKLRNFWVALAIGCAFSMGTSSCGDDDDDEPKQEQVDKATEAGNVIKDVVDSYNLKGADLLDQATSMTKEQLQNLAETVVEYNKNKNNAEWMQKFLGAAASSEADKKATTELLDKSISQIENLGVVMDEITTQDLLDVFSEYFEGKDQLGQGEADGIKQGATHKDLFDAIYEEKLASIPATEEGLESMLNVFQTLPTDQQKELVNVVLAWANKSDDAAWQSGFLSSVMSDSASQQGLKEKLDFLAQYKSFIAAMA